nr:endo alpha-1,4 polygalactosaminidase [Agrococcus sp. ARC_14]
MLLAALLLGLTACQAAPVDETDWRLPSTDGAVDYQLGGASEPPQGVTIVVRDSTALPAAGRYSICYINGFQTQPAERGLWLEEHPDAVLTGDGGVPVVDPGWPDELVLDTRTEAARAEIAGVLAASIDRCAEVGFDAVELDNLDTWTRFDALTVEGNLALAALLVEHAHVAGLAVAQKNAPELAERGPAVGFDLAISEECAAWAECGAYAEQYGELHIDIEYEGALPEGTTFQELCERPESPHLMVLRDLQLVAPTEPGYVFERCAG